MKYTNEIIVNLPRARVVELFDDPSNLIRWQKGLQSFEPISGTPGEPGATSKLVFDFNGRPLEMIETILVRNLPEEFSGAYDAKNVHNIVRNFFYEDGPDRTRLVTENEFKFRGIMRIAGVIFGGSFRKASERYLVDFKAFAEAEDAEEFSEVDSSAEEVSVDDTSAIGSSAG